MIPRFLVLSVAALLVACGSPYAVYMNPDPQTAATAQVVFRNDGAVNPLVGVTNVSLHIYAPDGACDASTGARFQDAYRGSMRVDQRVTEFSVEADRHVFFRISYLQYDQEQQASCNLVFGFLPNAGQRYDLSLILDRTSCRADLTQAVGVVPMVSPAQCFATW